jgi:hypothetical protein
MDIKENFSGWISRSFQICGKHLEIFVMEVEKKIHVGSWVHRVLGVSFLTVL